MKVDSKCKFCGMALTLSVSDDYAAMGDPFNLVRLAACNRCADYRVARRKIIDSVKVIAERFIQHQVGKDSLETEKEKLADLVKRYMRLLADFRRLPVPEYDSAIVEDLVQRPTYFVTTMNQVAKLFQQKELVLIPPLAP